MQNDRNLTDRAAYDASFSGGERHGPSDSGTTLAGAAIILAGFGAILWFGAGDDGRSLAPGMVEPEAIVPADPVVPAPIR